MARKRRTRQHIIADLSVNHVERFAILAGYSVERIEHDYGIDLNLYTYNTLGEIENGSIFIQLKASDNPRYLKDNQYISLTLHKKDLTSWLAEPFPVILALYDVPQDKAYWLYVQRYFELLPSFALESVDQMHTVRLNVAQIVDITAIKQWAIFKKRILSQLGKVVKHV